MSKENYWRELAFVLRKTADAIEEALNNRARPDTETKVVLLLDRAWELRRKLGLTS